MDAKIACVCPPTDGGARHPDGDTVTLRDRLDFRGAATIRQVLGSFAEEAATFEEIGGMLVEHYLLVGIVGWTIRDDKNKPLPVTRANVRAFLDEHPIEAIAVGDVADGPYSRQVVLPLLKRASSSSPPTQTETATSQTTGGGSTRKRSKRSSTTSTRTGDIVKISSSPDGDGSTSQSSVSAA